MTPRINILIVDDEPKNLTVLETVLDDPGYRLVRAESANQALLALVAEEFALLILDIRMPEMNGFELAQMIKERKKTAQIPIIFLTAYYNEDQHVLTGYGTGAVDYLHKPVNPTILRSKVAVFAELYRKNHEIELANHALNDEVIERRLVEKRLRDLNDTLEHRVAERTEALRDVDRRKDEFLATLAHELRNPLAPVRNAVQLLYLKSPEIPEVKWASEVIDRQTQVLGRLIDDLMDVSRISRGKIELKRERVELAKVVQRAVETSRPLIEQNGHSLTLDLPPGSIIIDADPTRLAQVFLNLLNNAAKYTERGGKIELHAETNRNQVIVSVKDTGIGIPAANLPTIFEMFSQVETALSRSQGGLGIGLSLVKRLVEMLGGAIEARSEGLGQGSEFIVRLPIVVEQPGSQEAEGEPARGPQTAGLRILVVDDNRDAAATFSALLRAMGNELQIAYDGEEAVAAAATFRPHVVLCDIGLPKLNGYEACRLMKQQAWNDNMMFIAVTGWGQDEDRRKSRDAGFDEHLVKPVDTPYLLKLLSNIDKSAFRPIESRA